MNYFVFQRIPSSREYPFAESQPTSDVYVPTVRMVDGRSMANAYPEDEYTVKLPLEPDPPSLKKPSYLANTGQMLVFHHEVVPFITENFRLDGYESFALTVIDPKGRPWSRDYRLFNPFGTRDILDLDHEDIDITLDDDDEILDVETVVLDARKLHDLPDLFRLQEDPAWYVFSEALMNGIREKGYTNFEFRRLPVSKGTGPLRPNIVEVIKNARFLRKNK